MNKYFLEDKKRLKMKATAKTREYIELAGYTIIYEKVKIEADGRKRYEVSVFKDTYHYRTFNITSEGGLELEDDIRCLLSNMNKLV